MEIDTGAKQAISALAVKLFSKSNSNQLFFTDLRWFNEDQLLEEYVEEPDLSTMDEDTRTIDLAEVIRERFVGYNIPIASPCNAARRG